MERTLEQALKLKEINSFKAFDVSEFLKNKELKVVRIVKDYPLKIDVEIVKDDTSYLDGNGVSNVGKVFSIESKTNKRIGFMLANYDGKVLVDVNSANGKIVYGMLSITTDSFKLISKNGEIEAY